VHSVLPKNPVMNEAVSNLTTSQAQSDTTSTQLEDRDNCIPDDNPEGYSANKKETGKKFKVPAMSHQANSSKKGW
jgi:hypothetical protein